MEVFCIHRYFFDEVFAHGEFAKMWLCYNKDLHEALAAKVMSKRRLSQSGRAHEAELQGLLMHPNIVKSVENFETHASFVQVTDIYRTDLLNLVSEKELSVKEVARLTDQILSATEFVHAHHICHRDIKPDNILVDPNTLDVYLGDFGLASMTFDGYVSGSRGTVGFCAPEVLEKSPTYNGKKADIFSIGKTILSMFRGTVDQEEEDYQGIPDDWATLIKQMTDDNPDARPEISEIRAMPLFDDVENRFFENSFDTDIHESVDRIDVSTASRVAQIINCSYSKVQAMLTSRAPSIEKLYYHLLCEKWREVKNAPSKRHMSVQENAADEYISLRINGRSCDVINEMKKYVMPKQGCVSSPTVLKRSVVMNTVFGTWESFFDCIDEEDRDFECVLLFSEYNNKEDLVTSIISHLKTVFEVTCL